MNNKDIILNLIKEIREEIVKINNKPCYELSKENNLIFDYELVNISNSINLFLNQIDECDEFNLNQRINALNNYLKIIKSHNHVYIHTEDMIKSK